MVKIARIILISRCLSWHVRVGDLRGRKVELVFLFPALWNISTHDTWYTHHLNSTFNTPIKSKYVCHWKDQHLFHHYKTLKNFLSCKITSSIWGSSSISIKSSFSSLLSLASITSLHARISFIIDRWVTRENIEEKVFFDPTIWTWLLEMMMRWWWIWWQGTFTDKT